MTKKIKIDATKILGFSAKNATGSTTTQTGLSKPGGNAGNAGFVKPTGS